MTARIANLEDLFSGKDISLERFSEKSVPVSEGLQGRIFLLRGEPVDAKILGKIFKRYYWIPSEEFSGFILIRF